MADHEQLFRSLTGLLARYEPGDLATLSDLIDGCQAIKSAYPAGSVAATFLEQTLVTMGQALRGTAPEGFSSRLGSALDLLHRACDRLSPEAVRVEAEMARFYAPAASTVADDNPFLNDQNVRLFLTDGKERLSSAQDLLLQLEANPHDAENLASLFRVFHTFKGECGFLRLKNMGALTHHLENLLDLLRHSKIELTSEVVDLLLRGIDLGRSMLANLEAGWGDLVDDSDLAALLESLDHVKADVHPPLGQVLVETGKLRVGDVDAIVERQKSEHYQSQFGTIAVHENLISPSDLQQALDQQHLAAKKATVDPRQVEIIKVSLAKVNFLVDMIGELTIALGQVSEDSLAVAQVRKITRTLQSGAMELRTDTMQGLFGTMRRLVRDLSHSLGKQVEVRTEGDSLEVDRNLIRKLEEPLMHLVRNAIDHGLGSPEERSSRGKSEVGTLRLTAVRHGSTITVTVEDDGKGLDRDRILAKAIEQGLVSAELAGSLSDHQVYDFIFQPGFSTASKVSEVSGRGVGLDIVRSMVSHSRGMIRTRTVPGQGTTFVMTFPISTAVIDGMLVRVSGNTLIIPTGAVVESLKIPVTQLSRAGAAELITIREKVMPVLRLERVLGMEAKDLLDRGLGIVQERPYASPPFLLGLIVETSEHLPYFFAVDEILAKREVVVKPLGPRFHGLRGITSGTVLAGGTIGLVLDVDQVVQLDLQETKAEEAGEEASWK